MFREGVHIHRTERFTYASTGVQKGCKIVIAEVWRHEEQPARQPFDWEFTCTEWRSSLIQPTGVQKGCRIVILQVVL